MRFSSSDANSQRGFDDDAAVLAGAQLIFIRWSATAGHLARRRHGDVCVPLVITTDTIPDASFLAARGHFHDSPAKHTRKILLGRVGLHRGRQSPRLLRADMGAEISCARLAKRLRLDVASARHVCIIYATPPLASARPCARLSFAHTRHSRTATFPARFLDDTVSHATFHRPFPRVSSPRERRRRSSASRRLSSPTLTMPQDAGTGTCAPTACRRLAQARNYARQHDTAIRGRFMDTVFTIDEYIIATGTMRAAPCEHATSA